MTRRVQATIDAREGHSLLNKCLRIVHVPIHKHQYNVLLDAFERDDVNHNGIGGRRRTALASSFDVSLL